MEKKKKIIACIIITVIILIIFCSFSNNECNVFRDYCYFDSNGTTPMHEEALIAYNKSAYLGNVSADYAVCANNTLLQAKKTIYNWVNTSADTHQIVFNSGASEGNNYILRSLTTIMPGGMRPHYILSAVEHKTSIKCAECLQRNGKIDLTLVYPDIYGIIDPIEVAKNIRPNTILVSIMHFNNELGSINDLEEIGNVCKIHNVFFHSDVVQSFGKQPIDMKKCNLSAITASFHKFGGPLGVGALVMSNKLATKITGNEQISGSQFSGFRGGTENISGIAAADAAMRTTFKNRPVKNARMLRYKRQLIKALSKEFSILPYESIVSNMYLDPTAMTKKPVSVVFLGPNCEGKVAPNTLLMSFIRTDGSTKKLCNIKLKKMLLDKKVIISIGSVCNTKDKNASHVLNAIQVPQSIKPGVLRVSFGDHNTDREVNYLIKCLIECVKELCNI